MRATVALRYALFAAFVLTVPVSAEAMNAAPTVTIAASFTGASAVLFNATASDPDGDALTYSWNFGDGSPEDNSMNPSHQYVAGGQYVATLTVSDGMLSASSSVMIVMILDEAPSADSDGDGFSDELEASLGSNPHEATDTPLGFLRPEEGGQFSVSQFRMKFKFSATGRDSIDIAGMAKASADFNPDGQKAIVDIAGVIKSFEFNQKQKQPNSRMRLKVRHSKAADTDVKFSIALSGGTFSNALHVFGITENIKSSTITVPVTLYLANKVFKRETQLQYKSTRTVGSAKY